MSHQPARPIRATVAALLSVLLLIQTTGCYHWQTLQQPGPIAVAQNPNRRLQILLTNGLSITADSARVVGDTILVLLPDWNVNLGGLAKDSSRRLVSEWGETDTIPLPLVRGVRKQAISWGKTLLVILSLPVAVVGIGMLAWGLGTDWEFTY